MELKGDTLIAVLVILELVQIAGFVIFVRYRSRRWLRQLSRLTGQLATGQRPKSYYIDGPPLIEQVSRHLESVGARLEEFQRQQQEEDFNLNVLLANMVEGVMVVDQRHVVRLVNDELLNLFELKQSPLGRTVLESLREARVETIIRETIARGERGQQEVVLESSALGLSPRHFDISVVPIRAAKGEVRGAVAVFHDITRIKQLEVVRQEFVANVSHELRTPLAIFRGYLETLADNPDMPPEESQRILDTMKRHSDRLNALVEDLLILTRLEVRQVETEFSTIRVDAFFRQLVRDWGNRTNSAAVDIQIEMAGDLPPLDVDALRLEQVIFNLLENAVAYSNPPRRVVLSAARHDSRMEIRVIDNGIGIPPGDLPHIFERFYRVDKGRSRNSGGTGLGLAIVKHIVQSHGGTVHAESEVGKGTTVVLRLPLRQGGGETRELSGVGQIGGK
ncbi:MAG TPA: ATP-binding protein [Candidatus Methylacidiphilales bacterium]|jgi:two-component system phosphate regulon sensor histidine kinase PhoR|nr:ATP-binding protein [Candidatus Methylacidiphilales bacterium]